MAKEPPKEAPEKPKSFKQLRQSMYYQCVLPSIPKQHRNLYARTPAGDHGHPRASTRAVLSVVSIVLDTQNTDVNLEIHWVTAK